MPQNVSPESILQVEGTYIGEWCRAQRNLLIESLLNTGFVLCRGLGRIEIADLVSLVRCVSGEDPMAYIERSSPRRKIADGIYTSTDYPSDQTIPMHNENSYASCWPLHLYFACMRPAKSGGETPIADCRRVLNLISAKTRQEFEDRGWKYVRNLRPELGLTWQEVFQTSHREQVESYCRNAGISYDWKGPEWLKVWRTGSAVRAHPRMTEEQIWFNHIVSFNVLSLPGEVREALLGRYGEEGLPLQTYYGDGGRIGQSVIEELACAYAEVSLQFCWEAGDILILDNMRMAHSRLPYSGVRKVAVAMAVPVRG